MHGCIGLQLLPFRVHGSTGVVVLSFGMAILTEILALMMLSNTASGEVQFIVALFMPTSAVCVTSLTGLDTGS